MSEIVMKVIGNYTYNTRDCLGEGVFGKVFEGHDRDTKERVAIKQVDINSYSHDKYLETSIFYQIFLLKNLNHPNIISFKDVLSTKNSLYIVTEFCKQGDLKELLKRKKFKEEEAFDVIGQIVNGFHLLVKEHIIHRDLKPANIMINDEVYKIGDFGFAKYVDNMGKQMLKSCVGSPIYMAPQILEHSLYTTKADIWSIGIISYEILFGSPPWKARNQAQLLQNIRTTSLNSIIRSQPIRVTQFTVDFLNKLLAYQEKDRMEWEDLFAVFKIQSLPQPKVEQRLQKQRAITTISSTNQSINNNHIKGNLSQKPGANHVKVVPAFPTPSQPLAPNPSTIQPLLSHNNVPVVPKMVPLNRKSSLLTIQQIKRLREQSIYQHFVNAQFQSNYTMLRAAFVDSRKLDKFLLLLAGSAKLKCTYAISGVLSKLQVNKSYQDLCHQLEREKQSYQWSQKDTSKLLGRQGTLQALKQQIASVLSNIEAGENRIIKTEQLLYESTCEVARTIFDRIHTDYNGKVVGQEALPLIRALDYALDIIRLILSQHKDRQGDFVIALNRMDMGNATELLNAVQGREDFGHAMNSY